MSNTETCPGSGQPLVRDSYLNLLGCPECRCAWDPDLAATETPEHRPVQRKYRAPRD